jgi:four helix bundle protein
VVKSYKELIIWQKGITLVSIVYRANDSFPDREKFALSDQMRRAVVSVPSNIAEGFGRNSRPEMIRYAQFALGSLYELETQTIIAHTLGYLAMDSFKQIGDAIGELAAMLQSFVYNLRYSKKPESPKPSSTQ